jgi:outer membrane protein, adhesin transport system
MGEPLRDLKKRTVIACATFAVALAASGATAQQRAQFDLESAIRDAVAWHPSIAEAVGTRAARETDVDVARAGYSPQISAGVGSGYNNSLSKQWRPRPEVGGSQMLFDFGKVASAVDAARAGTRAGHAQLLIAIDDLIRETGNTVVELQRAAALRAVAVAQLSSISEISKLVTDRFETGATTESDALQARARVDAAKTMLMQVEAEERRWASNLSYLLGHPASADTLAPQVPGWLMASCSRAALGSDQVPSVMLAEALKERAQADLRRSRADRMPTIALAGSASTDFASPFGDQSLYSFGLRVTNNVFTGGGTRAKVRGATYALSAAEAATRRAQVENDQRLAEAQRQVDSLNALLANQASREVLMVKTGQLYRMQYLEMGTRTLVDLLNAEQELYQIRFDTVNNEHDLRRLQLDCLYYSGRARDAFGLSGTSVRGVML